MPVPQSSHRIEGSPTVATRLLANELRRLRLAANLEQRQVAQDLGCTSSRVGHLESRRNQVRRSDLAVMLPLYGVEKDRWDWYFDLAAKAKGTGWWDGDAGVPEWFSSFVGLEWGAARIQNWETSVVPGLVQTSAYMEALFRTNPERSDQDAAKYFEQRKRRQQALDRRGEPLMLHVVIDEAALHRLVGGPQVMSKQLSQLAQYRDHPHVTIQILPFAAGAHQGSQGGFHILDFNASDDNGVVYVETRCGGLYLEKDDEIAEYQAVFRSLVTAALSSEKSAHMLKKLAKELTLDVAGVFKTEVEEVEPQR